jgi:hypothetical protein
MMNRVAPWLSDDVGMRWHQEWRQWGRASPTHTHAHTHAHAHAHARTRAHLHRGVGVPVDGLVHGRLQRRVAHAIEEACQPRPRVNLPRHLHHTHTRTHTHTHTNTHTHTRTRTHTHTHTHTHTRSERGLAPQGWMLWTGVGVWGSERGWGPQEVRARFVAAITRGPQNSRMQFHPRTQAESHAHTALEQAHL